MAMYSMKTISSILLNKCPLPLSAGQFTFISSWNHPECNSGGGGGGVEELCTSYQARIQRLSYEYILRALRPIPRTTINLGVR